MAAPIGWGPNGEAPRLRLHSPDGWRRVHPDPPGPGSHWPTEDSGLGETGSTQEKSSLPSRLTIPLAGQYAPDVGSPALSCGVLELTEAPQGV